MRLLKVSKDIIICVESYYISELQTKELHVKGWAFSKESKVPLQIKVLEMESANTKILQGERQDVFESYQMYEGALNSGFTIIISHFETKGIIKIKFKDIINNRNRTYTINVKQLLKEKDKLNNNQSKDFKNNYRIIKNQNTTKKIHFNKFEKPLVSIVIPVYNQWNYTYSCLQSILKNTWNIPYEVIVADDASTDETVNIYNHIENIIVIRNKKNLGFLLNCNNAVKHAKGEYIQLLNNDTKVQKDWLKFLLELIESDKNIGIVGSKFIYRNKKLQEAGGIIWKDASGSRYGRLDDSEKPEYNYVKEVDYISGASIMIRKELWEKIGGFDERFAPAYFEDTDLAFEVRMNGYKVMYQPKSVVIHYEGGSYGLDEKEVKKSRNKKNKQELLKKWSEILGEEHFSKGEDIFLARDRARNKKTILVIDHYAPNYDKDAGSITIYQYLKLFIEKDFNVKFIGDDFTRHEPYTSNLQAFGIEVFYGDWYSKNYEEWIKENAKYIEYVFLSRPNTSIKYIDFIKKNTNAKIIYYGHDLHYLRKKSEYKITGDQSLLKSSQKCYETEFEVMRKSDVVYYSSQVEVDEIRKEDISINVKAIPAYIFDEKKSTETITFDKRKDLLFVGGFSHKPNVDAVLWFVKEIFPLILKEIRDIKFYIVGSNPPEVIRNLKNHRIVVTGFVTNNELKEYYDICKIAVAPLRYGGGVKRKVVEAMYHQIPIVTTSIGAEGLLDVEKYLTICDDKNEFAKTLLRYYKNNSILEAISSKSYDYIKDHFSSENAMRIIGDDIY